MNIVLRSRVFVCVSTNEAGLSCFFNLILETVKLFTAYSVSTKTVHLLVVYDCNGFSKKIYPFLTM